MGRVSSPPPGRGSPSVAGRDPRRPWAPSPFTRLARTHAGSVSGDALFAIGLAGSVFFDLNFSAARWRVALYLVLTIAPFAVAAPVIGPAIDRIRGGRRWIIVGSLALRCVLAVLIVRHMNTLLFYPEAFGMLVLQKVYSISKSAVVPGTVRSDEELVEANSKLTVLSAVAVVIAAAPGGLLLVIGGGRWSVAAGAVVYAVGTAFALRLPPTTVAATPAGPAEKEELRSAGILLAASSMGLMRGIVGFLAFMLAFDFKSSGAPLWHLGVVAAAAQAGFFVGAVMAPRLRRLVTEEHILTATLLATTVGGLVTAVIGGMVGAALLSMLVGSTASAAKQSFDSIVQRDAPDANRGRSFARFETRFQLLWVIGALLPILIPIPSEVGFALIALAAGVTAAWYLVGQRGIRNGRVPQRRSPRLAARLVTRARRGGDAAPVGGAEGASGPPPPPGTSATWQPAPPPPPPTAPRAEPRPAPPPPPAPSSPPGADGPGPAPSVSPHDPTVVEPRPDPDGSDPTLFDALDAAASTSPAGRPAPSSSDQARRWMRAGGDAPVPGPGPGASGADHTSVLPGGDPTTVARPGRRDDQGLLFGPEDWDDPLPEEEEPPDFR